MGVQINGDTGNVIATKGTFSGDVGIGGTLTYEDVTNVDSVGLITARQGIKIGSGVGVAASISVDGNAEFAGIVTATTFKGDGSQLSNITSTTINNNADNRLITGSGTANTLEGESNLTYDGTNVTTTVSGNSGYKINASGNNAPQIRGDANRGAQGNTLLSVHGDWNGTAVTMIDLQAGADTTNKDDGQIQFYTSPDSGTGIQNRMTIDSNGYVTKPNLPYFNVTADPSLTSNYIHSFANVSSNNGSHYNNTNGRFTAPVAGFYWFSCGIWCSASNGASAFLQLTRNINASSSDVAFAGCNHTTQFNSLNASGGTYMAKDDYAWIKISGVTIQASTPRNFFCGYLVG